MWHMLLTSMIVVAGWREQWQSVLLREGQATAFVGVAVELNTTLDVLIVFHVDSRHLTSFPIHIEPNLVVREIRRVALS